MDHSKRETDLRLLALGALIGLVMAGFGILRQSPDGSALPADMLARVNDTLISREHYERTIARQPGTSVTSTDEDVLQMLIDDELLVQRGVELGMMNSDLVVRQAVIDSLVASITAEADTADPTEAELEAYLAENAERFSYVAKISIEAWQSDRESAAQELVEKLRAGTSDISGEDIDRMADLPTGLIPLEIAVDYVGPGVASTAATMPPGSSAVFARRGRWLVLRLLEKESSAATNLAAIRNRVLIDYRRHLADETLRSYIDGLRDRASITVDGH
ncbi:MAG: peptidylprolyl isomerase [Woeseiaceae bacterium]